MVTTPKGIKLLQRLLAGLEVKHVEEAFEKFSRCPECD
jgi:hypothetical protein